ncbi:MAG: helix-turn-helix domain-containing protein [Congregibacter sp.]
MSTPSNWPLSSDAVRLLTPGFILETLAKHPLTAGCYPTAMGFYPSAMGHQMLREKHDDNLLFLCTEGRGELETSAGSVEVRSGDTVVLPQGEAHSYRASEEHAWTLYWVHFRGARSSQFIDHLLHGETHCLHTGVEPSLIAGFQQMLAADTTGYNLNAFIAASNRLRHLLAEFALCRDRHRESSMGRMDLGKLQRFMRERVSGSVSLAELAAFTGLTPQHFSLRYKAETGYPPLRHFAHMKIEAACRLLDSTRDSVKSVGAQLGYSDPLYFSRVFRRTLGLSPSQYRDSLRR